MNLLEQVARHLEFVGIGNMATYEEAGDIYYGYLPDKPESAVCVFSSDSAYPGSKDGARIQIYTRGVVGDAKTPYELACRITDELRGYMGFLAGDGPDVQIEVINSAQGMGLDSSGRHIYSSNYRILYCDY
ncbi:MAG: hypothetical protein IKK34_08045 [Clostridia bacterium]|nr:hypothetical protein [Clostridia bacterium]